MLSKDCAGQSKLKKKRAILNCLVHHPVGLILAHEEKKQSSGRAVKDDTQKREKDNLLGRPSNMNCCEVKGGGRRLVGYRPAKRFRICSLQVRVKEIGRMSQALPALLSVLRGKWQQSDKGQSFDLCILYLRLKNEGGFSTPTLKQTRGFNSVSIEEKKKNVVPFSPHGLMSSTIFCLCVLYPLYACDTVGFK